MRVLKTSMWIVALMAFCTGIMSCRMKTPMTDDQVIKIADQAVRQHGQNPNDFDIRLFTRSDGLRVPEGSEITKYNYVIVAYSRRELAAGGSLIVFINRDTGTILWVLDIV